MAWESPLQSGSKSYSHKRRNARFKGAWRVHTPPCPPNRAHSGSQGETGAFRVGALSLPSERFARFGTPAWPGVGTANFAAFRSWSRVLPKNAESLWYSDALMRVAVPRRRGPVGTRSPATGSCAVLVSFTVCHRCVEIQERAFTRLAVPTALSVLCDVQWFCPMQ